MAISLKETIEITRPVEEVFDYVSDVKNDAKWQKTVVEARLTSEEPIRVGTTGIHRVKFMGMTDDYGWEVTDYEAPRLASWRFVSGPITGRGGYALESVPGGTRLTWEMDVQPHGLRRLLVPMMAPMFGMETRKELGMLKRLLEG